MHNALLGNNAANNVQFHQNHTSIDSIDIPHYNRNAVIDNVDDLPVKVHRISNYGNANVHAASNGLRVHTLENTGSISFGLQELGTYMDKVNNTNKSSKTPTVIRKDRVGMHIGNFNNGGNLSIGLQELRGTVMTGTKINAPTSIRPDRVGLVMRNTVANAPITIGLLL